MLLDQSLNNHAAAPHLCLAMAEIIQSAAADGMEIKLKIISLLNLPKSNASNQTRRGAETCNQPSRRLFYAYSAYFRSI
jgi:hypothetical protein